MSSKKPLAVLLSAALAGSSYAAQAEQVAEEAVVIPSFTVTADPLGNRTADELLIPVTVISGDELTKRLNGTLGETLDSLPGVSNADFGPGVGRPVIRGLQGSRVQVLEDGLATADISGEGADHPIAIDVGRAEQIEVFRGPATLLYGSGAAGGVINVKSDRFNPEFGEKPRINGQASYGLNGHDRQGRLGYELPVSESFVLRTDYGFRRSSDFDIDGFQATDQTIGNKDKLQNSDVENDTFTVTGLFKGDWGFAGLGYSFYETDYGIPEVFLSQGEEEQERIQAKQDRFDFRGELYDPLPGFETARLKLARTTYRQDEVAFEFDDGALAETEVEANFTNKQYDSRLELVHNPIGLWQGVMGIQYTDREFVGEAEGDGFYIRPTDTRSLGLFLLEERPTSFGRIELAARIDHVRASSANLVDDRSVMVGGQSISQAANLSTQTYTPFSLSAGTIIDVDNAHHLRFALTRSQRAPTAEQLYAFGRHKAASTFEIGAPNLDEETYTNFEIGFDRHSGLLRYDASVFYNRVKDYVYLESRDDGTGQAVTIDGDTLVFNRQEDAEFYGAEFTAIADVIKGPIPLSIRLSGDHVRAKFRDGGDIPRITPTRLGLGFDTGYGDWDVSIDYRHVFKQTKTAILEDDTDGYNLLSFDMFWRPELFRGGEVFISGRNLLNEDGRRHQSFLKDDAPIIGRTLITGIRFDFGG